MIDFGVGVTGVDSGDSGKNIWIYQGDISLQKFFEYFIHVFQRGFHVISLDSMWNHVHKVIEERG